MIGMWSRALALAVVPLTMAAAACDQRESPPKPALIPALVAPVLPAPTAAPAAPLESATASTGPATQAPAAVPSESTASGLTRTLIDKPETPSMPRTLVFGDSLITRSRGQLEAQSKQITVSGFPGTAPCDWLTSGLYAKTIRVEKPTAVVLAFIGNNVTPCMRDGTQTAAKYLSGAGLVAKYRADVADAVRIARSQHVSRVILVRPPAKQADPSSQTFIDAYTRDQDAQLCEAGRAVSSAEHVADGVHLTAKGSAEYAKAIVDCVLEP